MPNITPISHLVTEWWMSWYPNLECFQFVSSKYFLRPLFLDKLNQPMKGDSRWIAPWTFTENRTHDKSEKLVINKSGDSLSNWHIHRSATLPPLQKSSINFDILNGTPSKLYYFRSILALWIFFHYTFLYLSLSVFEKSIIFSIFGQNIVPIGFLIKS